MVGKAEWNRTLERPKLNWEDNIKVYIYEKVLGGVNWIYVVVYSYKLPVKELHCI